MWNQTKSCRVSRQTVGYPYNTTSNNCLTMATQNLGLITGLLTDHCQVLSDVRLHNCTKLGNMGPRFKTLTLIQEDLPSLDIFRRENDEISVTFFVFIGKIEK